MSSETLALGRSLIRLTVAPAEGDSGSTPRRGCRRIGWIERTLESLRPQLDPPAFERLVSALAMVVGWEALIVLQGLRGLPPGEPVETSLWAACPLIRAALYDRS